jgi:hypothetical protein
MSASIASAVVLPEPEEEPPLAASPPNPHKRRQSSVTEDSAKRPRFEDDDVPTARRESATESKPEVPTRRERGRERRLFGAALGALSQNSATAGQKRRLEIEKRQLAQRKLEDEESEQRKAERMARRRTQRWREQKVFETQAVRPLATPCYTLLLLTFRSDKSTTRQPPQYGTFLVYRNRATIGEWFRWWRWRALQRANMVHSTTSLGRPAQRKKTGFKTRLRMLERPSDVSWKNTRFARTKRAGERDEHR